MIRWNGVALFQHSIQLAQTGRRSFWYYFVSLLKYDLIFFSFRPLARHS